MIHGAAPAGVVSRPEVGVRPAGPASGPSFEPGVVFARPGRRVWAVVLDVLAAGVVYAVGSFLAVLLVLVGFSSGLGSAALLGLVLPVLTFVGWMVAMWVWEARDRQRFGSRLLGLRMVDVSTLGAPGLGRVFVWNLLLRGIGGVVAYLVGLLAGAAGVPTFIGRTAPSGGGQLLVATVVSLVGAVPMLVVAGSCVRDRGPFRQGWHERASGTTMVTALSLERRVSAVGSAAGAGCSSHRPVTVGSIRLRRTPALRPRSQCRFREHCPFRSRLPFRIRSRWRSRPPRWRREHCRFPLPRLPV